MNMVKSILLACFVLLFFISCSSSQKDLESIVITMTDSKDTYTVTDKQQMCTIEDAISKYAKMEGIVDMITPAPIELVMNYSDKSDKIICLYIYDSDKRSSLTHAEDDSIVYRTTEEITNQLKDILSDIMNKR